MRTTVRVTKHAIQRYWKRIMKCKGKVNDKIRPYIEKELIDATPQLATVMDGTYRTNNRFRTVVKNAHIVTVLKKHQTSGRRPAIS